MEFIDSISYLGFYALAACSVIFALGMIFLPNLVRAGFMLVGSFSSVAGLYFLLNANFVAVSQILIYAVGIVLVIVFAIMLSKLNEKANLPKDPEDKKELGLRNILAIFMSLGVAYGLIKVVVLEQNWSIIRKITLAEAHEVVIPEISKSYTSLIGENMLSNYLLAFELVSVLLLAVLVGVIILSKKNIEGEN